MWDVVLDALLDTLKLFPFLFLLYLLIEVMEHNTGVGKPRRSLTKKWAPALGAGLGLVPMCGFSVMAAKLYEHRHVTIGTLVAVFITTNDEALLVLLLSQMELVPKLLSVAALVGCKFVLGVAVGYLLDALHKRELSPLPEGHVHGHAREEHGGHVHDHTHEDGHGGHVHHEEDEAEHDRGDCACDELSPCEHSKKSGVRIYFVSPLLHALQVAAFVLLVNLALGLLLAWLGEDRVSAFMQGTAYWFQPVFCALFGLIPNCASSVVLAEVYALGGIGFGGLFAGLVVNAGLGYLVLFQRGHWKRGSSIVAGMVVLGIAAGYCASAVSLLF